TTITNEDGIALAIEFRPNDIPGPYQIAVRTDYLGEFATATIRQTNLGPKKSMGKLIVIMAVAGAAGVALASRSGGGNSSAHPPNPSLPSATSVTAPTINFGG